MLAAIARPANTNHLALTGLPQQIYIELLAQKGQLFVIHLDFTIRDFEPVIRFSLSNMFDAVKMTSGNVVQIPFNKSSADKWSVVVIDVPQYLFNGDIFKGSTIRPKRGSQHFLRNVQICSQIACRGIYTSDTLYSHQVRTPRPFLMLFL